jgi:hypothetical protein
MPGRVLFVINVSEVGYEQRQTPVLLTSSDGDADDDNRGDEVDNDPNQRT